jgi:hypothetical protein
MHGAVLVLMINLLAAKFQLELVITLLYSLPYLSSKGKLNDKRKLDFPTGLLKHNLYLIRSIADTLRMY